MIKVTQMKHNGVEKVIVVFDGEEKGNQNIRLEWSIEQAANVFNQLSNCKDIRDRSYIWTDFLK
jgi:hypothetical protein